MKKKVILTSIVVAFCIIILTVGGLVKSNLNKNIASGKYVSNNTTAANKLDKKVKNTLNESNNAANTEVNSAANNAASNTAVQNTNTAVNNTGNSSAASSTKTANSTKTTVSAANTAAPKQTQSSAQSNTNTSPAGTNTSTGQLGESTPANQTASPQPNFIIKNGLNGQIILSKTLDFAGKTVGDVTLAALRDAHISKECTGSGSTLYFQSIDGLKEKANGSNSGWLYYVKESTPNESCGAYTLKAGDTVKWLYSSN